MPIDLAFGQPKAKEAPPKYTGRALEQRSAILWELHNRLMVESARARDPGEKQALATAAQQVTFAMHYMKNGS